MAGSVSISSDLADLLRLSLAPGLGPVRIQRAIDALGSPGAVLRASQRDLMEVEGIGATIAERFAKATSEIERGLEDELSRAHEQGVIHVSCYSEAYPELLRNIPAAPLVLRVRGDLACVTEAPCAAIVGSRSCSAYGVEQTERFSAFLAESGLTVVSGGARGIDTAAHRAALRVKGRTCVVMGCGLSHCYPPENSELFDAVIDAGGAVISELPMRVGPSAENFPARNRIISGLSLGVLVIEAGLRSGALITARVAAEDQGREVMALPGRVDSAASHGALQLLRDGGAALVMNPREVLELLETPARHAHVGTHAWRYAGGGEATRPTSPPAPAPVAVEELTDSQRVIVEALASVRTLDEVSELTGLDAGVVRADATLLELKGVLQRAGGELVVKAPASRRGGESTARVKET